jgi:putative tryptophan/tyrosine transport system substrate-binding protein
MALPRIVALAAVIFSIISAALVANAQSTAKPHRIGYLSSASAAANRHLIDAFRQGLAEHGWTDGKNVVIEYRFADGRHDRLPELVAELIGLNVNVIAAGPTPPALAAKSATRTIPIVMTAVGDPVRLGLVASLARPGGNVTGVSFDVGLEVFAKGLELFRECVPKLRRVAVLANPTNPAQAVAMADVTAAARSLGLPLRVVETAGPDAFDAAFASIANDRVDGLLILIEPLFLVHRARLADLARHYRLPTMYAVRESVEAGGLMSYGPSLIDSYRRAAVFTDKILRGAKPSDLPVEQPTRFELVLSQKTAKALGVTIPRALLLRADHVIE